MIRISAAEYYASYDLAAYYYGKAVSVFAANGRYA